MEEDKKELQQTASKPKYCCAYIGNGCFDDQCGFMHVEKEQVDKMKKAGKAMAAAKRKAKRSQSAGAGS